MLQDRILKDISTNLNLNLELDLNLNLKPDLTSNFHKNFKNFNQPIKQLQNGSPSPHHREALDLGNKGNRQSYSKHFNTIDLFEHEIGSRAGSGETV